MSDKNKIILNYFPPAHRNKPSAAFSIFKSFLAQHGYDVKIIYWNFLFRQLTGSFSYDDVAKLIPYLIWFQQHYPDEKTYQRLETFIKTEKKEWAGQKKKVSEYMSSAMKEMDAVIKNVLQKEDFSNVALFGFSAKFYQWIPGIVVTNYLKKMEPDVNILLGGVPFRDSARFFLELFPELDYVIWGEGETPLLDLCKKMRYKNTRSHRLTNTVFRENDKIVCAEKKVIKSMALYELPFSDFSDYFEYVKGEQEEKDIRLPLNGIRGCHWNRCKFCVLSHDYKYREKEPETIINEIKYQSKKHHIYQFNFVDNTAIGKKTERFSHLLDKMIRLQKQTGNKYRFFGEILPAMLQSTHIKKMAKAGFLNVQIGYESLSDTILEKMNKSNRVAHNIWFIKQAVKFHIHVGGMNIIMGIPGEEEHEVQECLDNLYFLRFFLSKEHDIVHTSSSLGLYQGSIFYRNTTEEELNNYSKNPISALLPNKIIPWDNRFMVFGYTRFHIKNEDIWNHFWKVNSYFTDNHFYYEFKRAGNKIFFLEYCNNELIKKYLLQKVHLEILRIASDDVVNIRYLSEQLLKKSVIPENLQNELLQLKEKGLLYTSNDFEQIIGIPEIK